MSDKEEIIRLSSRLARYSGEDPETGLRNLRQFLLDCSRDFRRSQRTGESLHLIAFRPVFDLEPATVADKLRHAVTPEALLARIGASSFALLLPEEDARRSLLFLKELSSNTPLYIVSRSLSSKELQATTPQKLLREMLKTLDEHGKSGIYLQRGTSSMPSDS